MNESIHKLYCFQPFHLGSLLGRGQTILFPAISSRVTLLGRGQRPNTRSKNNITSERHKMFIAEKQGPQRMNWSLSYEA